MNLMDVIMQAQGGGAVRQMAQQFGIGEDQAQSAIGAVLPMLAGAVQQNVQGGGVEGLLGALQGGNHQRFLDDPHALFSQEGVKEGNGILGHLFGDKEVSRQVASHASAQTGVGADIIKQMLPMVAGLLMGGMSRQSNSSGLLGQALGAAMGGGSGGAGGMIGSVLGSLLGGGGGAPPQQHAQPAAASGILDMLGPLLGGGGGGGGGQQSHNNSAMETVLGLASQFLSSRR
jgi:hypothetical protein